MDLAQLRAVYACHDTALLTALEEENADLLSQDDEENDESVLEDEVPEAGWSVAIGDLGQSSAPTLRQALGEIIEGTVPAVENGWQYWYAYQLLCGHFGTPLPNDQFDGIRGSALAVLEELDGLHDLALISRRPMPFALPPPADFPAVTYLTRDEIAATLARLLPVILSAPYEDQWEDWDTQTRDAWIQEGVKRMQIQYRGWLEDAMRERRDLVAFLS